MGTRIQNIFYFLQVKCTLWTGSILGSLDQRRGVHKFTLSVHLSVNQNRPLLTPNAISEHFEHFLAKMKKNKFSMVKKKYITKKSVNL